MQKTSNRPGQRVSPADITVEFDRLASLPLDALRTTWRLEFRKGPPKALSRDLLLRALAWQLQERAFGGHDKATERLLDSYGRKGGGDWQLYQRLRSGTVLVREYAGVRHTVTLVPEGFIWQEKAFSSLSAIAKLITGSNWNGPRFFGLRDGGKAKLDPNQTRAA